jgi:aryl-alcohol dehydrogenase-like predicted oxidoreductase
MCHPFVKTQAHELTMSSTKKIKYLEENLGAANVALTKDEEADIRKAIDETEVIGGRYSDA